MSQKLFSLCIMQLMVEIPKIRLYYEKLSVITGLTIVKASGTSYIKQNVNIIGYKMKQWHFAGKYLWITITKGKSTLMIRTHMLMFGRITFDLELDRKPQMCVEFNNGSVLRWFGGSQIKILDYNCNTDIVTSNYIECSSRKIIDDSYRMMTMDPSNDNYSMTVHYNYIIDNLYKLNSDTILTDLLLDQEFFPGVGNIVQQELLYRCKYNPNTEISALTKPMLKLLLTTLKKFIHRLIKEIKGGNGFKLVILIYHKAYCPLNHKTITKYISTRNRRTTWCNNCQKIIPKSKSSIIK